MSTGCPKASEANSTALAKEFLLALLDADEKLLLSQRHAKWMPAHMYLMSGMLPRLHASRPAIVGRLETFEDDWADLVTVLGLPPFSTLNKSLGVHPHTSGDAWPRRAAMIELLDAEPPLKAALLHLLSLDYACFGYCWPE